MTVVSGNLAFSTTTSSRSGKLKAIYYPLWLCFLLAILSRVWLIVHTFGVMAGDELVVGLQAEHILRGQLPLYYYGQPYLGSLDAYLAALIFRFTGPAVWAMRLETIPMGLLMVYLTWLFAAILADTAHLSARLKTTFMTIAALVAAFPPIYDMTMEMRVGGYMGAFVIMLWLLLCAFRLTQRWGQQASWRELAWRWVGIGLLVGLGLWIDPLIIYACAAIAIWIGGYFVLELVKLPRQPSGWSRLVLLYEEGLLVLSAVPALLVGFLPGLLWGAPNHWPNVFYLLHSGGTLSAGRLQTIAAIRRLYTYCLAPRRLGGALPTQPDVTTANPHLVTFGLFVAFSGLALGIASLFLSKRYPVFARVLQLTALPLLFFLCASIIFWVAPNSVAAVMSVCGAADCPVRTVVPLVDALPFLIATLIVFPGLVLRERQRSQAQQGEDAHRALRFTTSRRSTSLAVTQISLLVVLSFYVGAPRIRYAQDEPDYT